MKRLKAKRDLDFTIGRDFIVIVIRKTVLRKYGDPAIFLKSINRLFLHPHVPLYVPNAVRLCLREIYIYIHTD